MPPRAAVRAALLTCAVAGVGLAPVFLPGVAAAAPGDTVTVTDCTEAALRAAIGAAPAGGTVAIACDDPIPVTAAGGSTIVVDKTLTISGTGHDVVVDGGLQTSLFAVQAPAGATAETLPTVTLRDLTLTRGWAQDTGYVGGGAVFNGAHLVVDGVAFTDNHAFNRGGAILSEGFGTTTVLDSTFTGNSVTCPLDGSGGGAIAVRQRGQTTITGSTFTGNTATGNASGGAVLAWVSSGFSGFPAVPPPSPLPPSPLSSPLVISDSAFTGNRTTVTGFAALDEQRMYGGGAVAAFDHPLTVTGTLFQDNAVESIIGYGGAVLAASIRDVPTVLTTVDVLDNGFADRQGVHPANGLGGGIALHGTPATVDDAIVDGNRAFVGGGLFTRGAPVELVSSTVDANTAGAVDDGDDNHGAALATRGPLVVRDTRMVGNAKGTCLVLRDPAAAPAGDVVVDGGGNEVEGAATCFRVPVPPAPPAATGSLSSPAAPIEPGAPVTLAGSGFAPHARVTLAAYPLVAAAEPGLAAAAAAPVDLGASPADASGVFAGAPVLPGAGVWRVVALGVDGSGAPVTLSTVVVVAAAGTDVAPVVTQQPSSAAGPAGTTVVLTAAAAGVPAPTVQWQRSDDGGAGWTDVPGATATSLSVPVLAVSASYRAVFTNVAGTATSAVAVVGGPAAPPGGGRPGSGSGTVPADGGGVNPAGAGTGAGGLARTGADLLPLAGAGAAFVLAGAALVTGARRRRNSSPAR